MMTTKESKYQTEENEEKIEENIDFSKLLAIVKVIGIVFLVLFFGIKIFLTFIK